MVVYIFFENYAKILKTSVPLSLISTYVHPQHFKIHKNDGVFQKSVEITNIFNNRNLEQYNCTCGDHYNYLMYNLQISSTCMLTNTYILQ